MIVSTLALTLLALVLACRLWLLARQSRSVHRARGAVPHAFAAAIPLAAPEKACDYTVANARLTMLDAILDTLIVLALVWGGALAWIDAQWRATGLSGVWLGITVTASVYIGSAVVGWPLSLYRVFGIETRFGFN